MATKNALQDTIYYAPYVTPLLPYSIKNNKNDIVLQNNRYFSFVLMPCLLNKKSEYLGAGKLTTSI